MRPRPRRAARTPGRALGRASALATAALAWSAACGPAAAGARTTLFLRSFVSSNDVRGLAEWGGGLALATDGGVVLHEPASGAFRKILRGPLGLPSNRTLCVARSPSGALWIGTGDRGVARLKPDGSFRRTLTSFDGLPSDRVQTLYVRGDSIWVGTSGGVALFTENPLGGQATLRRADTSASTGGELPGDDVRAFAQVGDTLWCATASGMASFASGAWQRRTQALSQATTGLSIFADTLWAATAQGPRRYAGGLFAVVAGGHPGASRSLHAGSGALYSGTAASGVYAYANGAWGPTGGGLPASPVAAVLEISDGSLWSATALALARYDATALTWTLRPSDGPLVNGTHRAIADGRGVWFTTDGAVLPGGGRGAVLHYDGVRWTALTAAGTGGSFQGSDAFGILSDRSGRIWIGHCCSDVEPKPRVDRFDPADSAWILPPATNLFTFAEAPSGRVFGGSVELGNGVYEFDAASGALLDSLTPFNTQGGTGPGLASNNLRGIAFDRDGKGWFAHESRALDVWDGRGTPDHADDAWTHVETGFPAFQARALAVLGPTRAWVGTTGGVVRVDGSQVTRSITPSSNPPLPSGLVNDLAADPSGTVWIATAAGLARVDGADGTLEVFTVQDGLMDDDVRSLAWDPASGSLWIGTAGGISAAIPGREGRAGFSDATFLYPNPLRDPAVALRLGAITNAIEGEIRDLAGGLVRRFRCDPVSNEIWDLRRADGSLAAPGVYLVVLRDRGSSRVLRAAVIR